MCHDPLDAFKCWLLDVSRLEFDFVCDASQSLNFTRAMVLMFFVVVDKSKERL